MRFFDNDNNKAVKNLTLYLTINEAKELLSDLQANLDNYGKNYHSHIYDESYNHELTVVLYDKENLKAFDERSVKLIVNDE